MSDDQGSYSRYLLNAMAATASSMLPSRSPIATASPASTIMPAQAHDSPMARRTRGRDLWGLLGKAPIRDDEEEDEAMQVDDDPEEQSITFTPPPTLPKCSLDVDFQCSDTRAPVPPAFYPGQAIPTVLTYQLDRHSSLPHAYNPTLTMSLVGTLETPNTAPRTIICVSVSLAEGLALWARDAAQAYASRPPPNVDPSKGLPGGTYSLPLTVQVPSAPRLPPSFTVPGAQFAVTYALNVTLTCDDTARPGCRVVLAEASKAFEMMPETLPTRTPRYHPQSFFVRSEAPVDPVEPKPLARKTNSRWTVQPSIPTTAYSPTSQVPLTMTLLPPPEPSEMSYQVLVRMALVRREHATHKPEDLRDPHGHAGLIKEEEINSRYTWFESRRGQAIEIKDAIMPIMLNGSWQYGYSTVLNVGPPVSPSTTTNPEHPVGETIAVSSTFHLATTMAFLPIPFGDASTPPSTMPSLSQYVARLPPQGQWTPAVPAWSAEALDLPTFKRHFPGSVRMLPLPIVIGSVSEPRSAMHSFRWSDLHLDNSSGREVGRMVHGETTSSEDGWIQAPPAYREAIDSVPYCYN